MQSPGSIAHAWLWMQMRPILKSAFPVQPLLPLCLGAAELSRETLREAAGLNPARAAESSLLSWAGARPLQGEPPVLAVGPPALLGHPTAGWLQRPVGQSTSCVWQSLCSHFPSVLAPTCCCSPSHTVLSLCLRGKDKPLLLPPPPPLTNGGKSAGPHCNTRRDKMGVFLLTELLYLHLGRFEIHGRKADFSWYLLWWCDNLDCHHRADGFCSSWGKIISAREV